MADKSKKAAESESDPKLELVKEIKLSTALLAVCAGANDHQVFASCFDGGIYEINLDSGDRRLIGKHKSYASGVQFFAKTNTLISSGYDGCLIWHDPVEGKSIKTVQAHKFWSWQMDVSNDGKFVASVTGQYLAGGYKYEPAPEQEPCVKIFDGKSGELIHAFSHLPPVLSVAISPDNRFIAAANMMGDIKVWDLESGKLSAEWNTDAFTSWGIIKSHHYVGGIFGLEFTPDSTELLACGMGPMNDPMAGNGKQLWQRFAWAEKPPKKSGQIDGGENGNGLMEIIQFHPSKKYFLMAGRLAQGKWNAGFFDAASGKLIHSADTKMRVVDAVFLEGGSKLVLAGASGQEKKKDGKYPEFGRLKIYRCNV